MRGPVAAILLAAGKSRRMGICKQLLPLGDRTVIVRCLDALVAGGMGEIVVVVSEEGAAVAEAVRAYPVRIVVNQAPDSDMSSSVRVGRDALTTAAGGVIVALCDYPLVSAATIVSLVAEYGNSPGSIIIPCHQERSGHPLLLPWTILDELTEDQMLRDLVRRNPALIQRLDVTDPGVLIDMDTPEDYHRICEMIKTSKQLRKDGYR